jgi:spermidine synthase
MNEFRAPPTTELSRPRPFVPLALLMLFVGSGCAALIYEIIWFQMLQLVIGSSAVSLAVLLGTFMGGLGVGSLALPRLMPRRWHPLRAFALLEGGLGLLGLALFFAAPIFSRVYIAGVGLGLPGIPLRALLAVACLLPPTLLMGATLPAISRWVETTPRGVAWLGFLYSGNLAGAVLGCLLAGFYLLRVHDLAVATGVAVAINSAVAALAFGLAAVAPIGAPPVPADPEPSASAVAQPSAAAWPVSIVIAVSGMCALSAEVVWTRLLSLILGASVYAFSIILAVFLLGLGIGGNLGAVTARRTSHLRTALGCCQLLLAGAIALAAHLLAQSLPYWPINPWLSRSPWFDFQLDLLRCAWAILPAACLWGASFPLALAGAAGPGQDPVRLVGKIYAANTLGAILGAVGSSLILIRWLGTQQIERLLVAFSAGAGLLMLASPLWSASAAKPRRPASSLARAATLALAASLAVWLVQGVPKVPWELIAFGRYLPSRDTSCTSLYAAEGLVASVAVTRSGDGKRFFSVCGKAEASTGSKDMRLQRMLGHLPALLHPQPRSALVVGCGAGVTAGSLTRYPTVGNIVICEIEPLIPARVAGYFDLENYDVVHNPRVKLVYDDARHFLLTTHDKFDLITSDPIHPWVKGSAVLFTREYFETCKQHLHAGGIVSQWVPLYESNDETVKSEIATFFEVFPNGTVWSNDEDGEGYDLVLLGQVDPLKIDPGQVQRRLNGDNYLAVVDSLQDAGFKSTLSLLSTYAGQAADLAPWFRHAEINRDSNLRLQYLAGWGLNLNQPEAIYSEILHYRRYPADLFVGSNEWTRALQRTFRPPKSGP